MGMRSLRDFSRRLLPCYRGPNQCAKSIDNQTQLARAIINTEAGLNGGRRISPDIGEIRGKSNPPAIHALEGLTPRSAFAVNA
jgi:hypothetical protein